MHNVTASDKFRLWSLMAMRVFYHLFCQHLMLVRICLLLGTVMLLHIHLCASIYNNIKLTLSYSFHSEICGMKYCHMTRKIWNTILILCCYMFAQLELKTGLLQDLSIICLLMHPEILFCSSKVDELEKRLAALKNPWMITPSRFQVLISSSSNWPIVFFCTKQRTTRFRYCVNIITRLLELRSGLFDNFYPN